MTDDLTPLDYDGPDRRGNDRRGGDRRGAADRRASVVDRRNGADRRDARTGLERLRGPGRRRTDFAKSAEEGEMTPEQFLFIMAIDAYKRVNNKPFPTWTEVLEVIRKLGYRKTQPSLLNLANAEDWSEQADAPAMAPKPSAEDDPEEAEVPEAALDEVP